MPQIIFLVAAGAALLLARRLMRGAHERVAEDLRQAREAMAARDDQDRSVTQLERDPVTGIYRPKQSNPH
jgi:hypothetical protein